MAVFFRAAIFAFSKNLMTMHRKNVAILGATGSIGQSTLKVIRALPEAFRAVALTGHSNLELLQRQVAEFHPRWAVATAPNSAKPRTIKNNETEWLYGEECIVPVVQQREVNIVLAAIVGSAGLLGTWAALEAGKTVALANKETLVMAGPLVMDLIAKNGASLIPVDSEHSAVFQAIQAGKRGEVKRVVLTASGGPFIHHTLEELNDVTVSDALKHPTWSMGTKITVDSATMMNKALEIIEARWLFDLAPDQIEVVIHPQSVVHSLVEFTDGAVIAQMGPPDMQLPIQYALTYPDRLSSPAGRLDLTSDFALEFSPPDMERFPALELGFEVAKVGGTAGAVVNAANEAAVQRFLSEEMAYTEIVPACRSVLENHEFDPTPTLDQLVRLDGWARAEVNRMVPA